MPSRWQTAIALLDKYDIKLTVIAPPKAAIAKVYDPSGYLTPATAGLCKLPDCVRLVDLIDPQSPGKGFNPDSLRQALQDSKPDIIWIHSEPTQRVTRDICSWYWRSWPNRPQIFQAVIDNLLQFPAHSSLSDRLLLHRITRFVAASKSTAANLHNSLHIAKRRIAVTYLPNQHIKVVDKIPHPRHIHTLGFAGRLVPEKGINVLLDALEQVDRRIGLVTAGHGGQAIESHLRNHPRIEHLGLVDNAEQLFSRIDTLVVPSRSTPTWEEQFGRIIAEALSYGLPVIGSDSGSVPDVIGDAGLIYPQACSHDLAECITQLAENPHLHANLAKRASLRFDHLFSIDAHARQLANVFNLQTRPEMLPASDITTFPDHISMPLQHQIRSSH